MTVSLNRPIVNRWDEVIYYKCFSWVHFKHFALFRPGIADGSLYHRAYEASLTTDNMRKASILFDLCK